MENPGVKTWISKKDTYFSPVAHTRGLLFIFILPRHTHNHDQSPFALLYMPVIVLSVDRAQRQEGLVLICEALPAEAKRRGGIHGPGQSGVSHPEGLHSIS